MKKQPEPTNERVLTEKVFIDTIRELREIFASKKDLERLATREDVGDIMDSKLNAYATKKDVEYIIDSKLNAYATKEDLKNELKKYSTKKDLEDVRDTILDAIKATDIDTKQNKAKLSDHEKRLSALELTKN